MDKDFHVEVARIIRAERQRLAQEVTVHRRAAEAAARDLRNLESAVLQGQWWALGRILSPNEVDLLCEEELDDRGLYLSDQYANCGEGG